MTNTLTGSKSAIFVTITTLQENSQQRFFEVIYFELLRTVNDKPQITVKSATCPNRNCDFEVLPPSAIPKLLSFTYTSSFLFNLYVDDKGTGMPLFTKEDIRVIFGNNECEVMSYNSGLTPSEIIAQCPLECGSYLPQVHYNRIGYAKNADNFTKVNLQLKITDSLPLSLNHHGGEILTLIGEGFPNSKAIAEKRSMKVTVGGYICSLISVNSTEIKCLTPSFVDPTVGVMLNGMTSTVSLAIFWNYPVINSVYPSIIQPLVETVITLTGIGFKDNIHTQVLFGKQQITPISITSSHITFKTSGVHSGNSQVIVQSPKGNFGGSIYVYSRMEITSFSPNSGSIAGGVMIKIGGEYFGEHAHYVSVDIDGLPCDIKKVTPTLIECEVPPQTNNSKIDKPLPVSVYVRGDRLFQSGGSNLFTYSTAETLKISEITSDKGVLQAGNHYLILGSGFGDTTTYPVEVSIDGIICDINGYLPEGVSFVVPAEITPNDAAVIKVFQTGRGYALFEVSNRVKVVPNIIAIPYLNCAPGGTLMKISGTGFAEGIKIKVGDIPCEIRACSAREISCKVTNSGLVTLEYKDFVNIQDPNWIVTLDNSSPVVITSVYPTTIPAYSSSFDLSIHLIQVRFSLIRAFLVSQFDPSLRFEGSNVTFTSAASSSFADIPAGNYTVEVLDDNNFAVNASNFTVPIVIPLRAEKLFTIGSPLSGGQTVDIGGYGFFNDVQKEKNLVTICGFPCKVVESSLTSIRCLSPSFKNAAVKAAYPQMFPIETLQGITWSNTGNEEVAFDGDLTNLFQ